MGQPVVPSVIDHTPLSRRNSLPCLHEGDVGRWENKPTAVPSDCAIASSKTPEPELANILTASDPGFPLPKATYLLTYLLPVVSTH